MTDAATKLQKVVSNDHRVVEDESSTYTKRIDNSSVARAF
jgi:hypothetical protein